MPAAPDDFLDDPAVVEANRRDDYMPYWAYLWPAARSTARLVADTDWPSGTRALEIGAGIGLVGIAGLARGLKLTFSDYDQRAIDLAIHNARLNGLPQTEGLFLDWRNLKGLNLEPFPIILGSDVIYELANHHLVLDAVDCLLTDNGLCWLGDPGRQHSAAFVRLAERRGYSIEIRDGENRTLPSVDGQPDLPMNEFRLLVLSRREQSQCR